VDDGPNWPGGGVGGPKRELDLLLVTPDGGGNGTTHCWWHDNKTHVKY
jgi:hypothetical protein